MPAYICPISQEAPRIPVLTNAGITYDFVSIARSMLRNEANANLDPSTRDVIETLIYNRVAKELNDELMQDITPLSNKEKIEAAMLYQKLVARYPQLKIKGIHTLEGMSALIENSAFRFEPDYVDADGRTSLYLAVRGGREDKVISLLRDGNVNPNQGITSERYAGKTPLIVATEKNHSSIARILLTDSRVDINLAERDGATALFIATQLGHEDMVAVLLAAPGIAVNKARNSGSTPIHVAALLGHARIVKALLVAGANPNLVACDGNTPADLALRKGRTNVVQALIPYLSYRPGMNTAHPSFITALNNLLRDSVERDFYLSKIIQNPLSFRFLLKNNNAILLELAKYREELWESLRESERLHLSSDARRAVMRHIVISCHEPDESLHHPLYTVFKSNKRRYSSGFFSGKSLIGEIEAYLDTPLMPQLNG